MAWCREATSHYMSQCWPRYLSPYGVTSPQWVNPFNNGYMGILINTFSSFMFYISRPSDIITLNMLHQTKIDLTIQWMCIRISITMESTFCSDYHNGRRDLKYWPMANTVHQRLSWSLFELIDFCLVYTKPLLRLILIFQKTNWQCYPPSVGSLYLGFSGLTRDAYGHQWMGQHRFMSWLGAC